MDIFGLHIDGNWVDDGSFLMAVGWAVARYVRRRRSPPRQARSRRSVNPFFGKATATDVANGVCIFPLCILATSLFSDWLLEALLMANRLILSVAGVAALFGVLEDF
ncbi:MAG TPA: hypothetical protein VGL08_05360 [Paraburkholderia sp.]|jgi:hypothetical protein